MTLSPGTTLAVVDPRKNEDTLCLSYRIRRYCSLLLNVSKGLEARQMLRLSPSTDRSLGLVADYECAAIHSHDMKIATMGKNVGLYWCAYILCPQMLSS